jgi:very-short-patch-repair endonuclease
MTDLLPQWHQAIVTIGVIGFIIAVIIGLLRTGRNATYGGLLGFASRLPYQKVKQLCTPAEKKFYKLLRQALGNEFAIYVKVRLADVLSVDETLPRKKRIRAFNMISSKHVDFVICDPKDMQILLAIELDDSSHNLPERKERDGFVDAAMKSAGMKLVHFPVKKYYDLAELKSKVYNGLP